MDDSLDQNRKQAGIIGRHARIIGRTICIKNRITSKIFSIIGQSLARSDLESLSSQIQSSRLD